MKQLFIYTISLIALFTSCNQETKNNSYKAVTFDVNQSFAQKGAADGLQDIWIFDYVDGKFQQKIHQTSTDKDFGRPSLNLTMGSHHLYFVISKGINPTLSEKDHTIIWEKPGDTFCANAIATISASSNKTQMLALNRVVARGAFIVPIEPVSTETTITLTSSKWYNGVDYLTGKPANEAPLTTTTVVSNKKSVGLILYTFCDESGLTTDVSVTAKDNEDNILFSKTINGVFLSRNHTSSYSHAGTSI